MEKAPEPVRTGSNNRKNRCSGRQASSIELKGVENEKIEQTDLPGHVEAM